MEYRIQSFASRFVPEMLKVKEGFHHDLNARASDELRGPTLPWKDGNCR